MLAPLPFSFISTLLHSSFFFQLLFHRRTLLFIYLPVCATPLSIYLLFRDLSISAHSGADWDRKHVRPLPRRHSSSSSSSGTSLDEDDPSSATEPSDRSDRDEEEQAPCGRSVDCGAAEQDDRHLPTSHSGAEMTTSESSSRVQDDEEEDEVRPLDEIQMSEERLLFDQHNKTHDHSLTHKKRRQRDKTPQVRQPAGKHKLDSDSSHDSPPLPSRSSPSSSPSAQSPSSPHQARSDHRHKASTRRI